MVLYLHCADLVSTWSQSCGPFHTQESALDLNLWKLLFHSIVYGVITKNSVHIQHGARLFPNQLILPSSLCAGVRFRSCTCVPKLHAQAAPFYFQTFICLLLRISLNLQSSCLRLPSSWDVAYASTSALSVFYLVGLIWASRTEGKIKGWLYPDAGVQHSREPHAEGPGLFPAAGTYYSPHHLP